ncbi:MAG: chaperone modulator CbpM [Gammaproteobacteria bacterium]
MKEPVSVTTVSILDENLELSLHQICRYCDLESDQVVEMVTEGIVEPRGDRPVNWRFNGYMLKRVQIATRLQRDLEINLPGIAVIIDLLNELEQLRQRSE